MKFYIKQNGNDAIVSNLEDTCLTCFEKCETVGSVVDCKKDVNSKRRFGKQLGIKGEFFLCCNQTKTTKLFREKLEFLMYMIPSFFTINNEAVKNISQKEQENFARIAHNLRKINAQNIHQLYDLVPQSILTENINNQLRIIQEHLLKDPQKASKMFLRIAQNSANIRTEFTVYDKLLIDNPNLSIRDHKIQSVILNVYHPFENEFEKNHIKFVIDSFNKNVRIDYDTFRVALFHIFSNSVKYVKQNSVFEIKFEESLNVKVVFSMTSLYISKEELPKLFDDKYSGVNARRLHKDGTGIGMGIIQKALKYNNAKLIVIPGSSIIKEKNIEYAYNKFIIYFKILNGV
jgi:signal transduction histidine kinase